jgi:hypothetical protein
VARRGIVRVDGSRLPPLCICNKPQKRKLSKRIPFVRLYLGFFLGSAILTLVPLLTNASNKGKVELVHRIHIISLKSKRKAS